MKRRTPRGLDPEEQSLWERIAQTATPLDPSAKNLSSDAERPQKLPKPKPRETMSAAKLSGFAIGSKASTALPKHKLAPTIIEQVKSQPVAMDKKAFKKLQRGQSRPEARLDLHGMTADRARDALATFILSAHASGKRLVLVITGKGKLSEDAGPIPTRVGVLRHQVPQWLSQPPLAPLILQTSHAHQRHGGSGALYVYLRRK